MRNWLKGRALLIVLVSISALIIFVPSEAKAAKSMEAPVSISDISHDFALLSVSFRVGNKLYATKLNKNNVFGNRVSAKQVVTPFSIYGYSIPNRHLFFDGSGNFNSVFRRASHRAYLSLDIPPPFSASL